MKQMRKNFFLLVLVASFAIPSGAFASGDSDQPASENAVNATAPAQRAEGPSESHRPGIGFTTSLLGLGAELAVPVTHRSNLRVGFSTFDYSRGFDKDGVTYSGKLGFRSAQAVDDFFPFSGAFHFSPGVMIYNGNQLTANAAVPGGQTFTLGGTDYMSDPSSPLSGNGKLQFSKAGPMFLVGFGNLARRSERHFGMSFDIGAVYQGTPRTSLNFAGRACDSIGFGCSDVATDPTFQSNVVSEQAKINRSLSPLRFFPIVSVGFGYKF
jgi:hypothetical protein